MLHRKVYQLAREGKDVWMYLRDQGRWIERAQILDIEGDTVLVRYETEDEDEICSWEEMVRLESIGAVAQRLSTIPKGPLAPDDLPIADECPEAELLSERSSPRSSMDDPESAPELNCSPEEWGINSPPNERE